ncbi:MULTISPECIES: hypothetical protein [Bradyrhizobium]|uniref:Uncharacterized protein n=1 Tax=Bradyrhizobium ottawaense TaxID=931866 RepID=A0ABV4FKB4_9BRAD|nr:MULTISPECIES: hypothetical protein [Bradyrhizobium]MBR1290357.1 hypothetical protein [Bradyrhizobium ottawaense]MDA9414266.1 hypothetical protein [Bradyrhizobium sp. CCBAU 25360]MDA9483363.1 hypothetical protein [Bradyrhizobium sp. CCBAU 11445]PDT70791.1 hypothetical protein CO683_08765 [Bradyrhizobium ottawaense]WLB44758.1 hypothetical protein QIH93_30175 [Bradyrhizobium ottawaense]
MSILQEALHDLLRVLAFATWGCAVVILAMAIRLAFLRAGASPEWRGLLTLRRPLASELSWEFHAANGQLMRLMLAFAAMLGIGALLFWLDTLLLPVSSNLMSVLSPGARD